MGICREGGFIPPYGELETIIKDCRLKMQNKFYTATVTTTWTIITRTTIVGFVKHEPCRFELCLAGTFCTTNGLAFIRGIHLKKLEIFNSVQNAKIRQGFRKNFFTIRKIVQVYMLGYAII